MGRDGVHKPFPNFSGISTHTPAWGVTGILAFFLNDFVISTHTPAWGVTGECRLQYVVLGISTHTPAWGVTKAEIKISYGGIFQLTRPRGA